MTSSPPLRRCSSTVRSRSERCIHQRDIGSRGLQRLPPQRRDTKRPNAQVTREADKTDKDAWVAVIRGTVLRLPRIANETPHHAHSTRIRCLSRGYLRICDTFKRSPPFYIQTKRISPQRCQRSATSKPLLFAIQGLRSRSRGAHRPGKKSEQTKKVTRSPWSKGATGAKYRVCSASLYSLRYRMRCNSSAGPAYYDPVCACRHQAHSTSIHLMCVFSHLSSSVRAHSRYSEGH